MIEYACINISSLCNMECPYCFRIGGEKGNIEIDKFELCLNKLIELGCNTLCITGGEPLMHPYWKKIITLTRNKGVKTILSTNGLLLDYEEINNIGLSVLSIPLDGPTEKINANTRSREQFLKVNSIIDRYKNDHADFALKVNTVVTKDNIQYLDKLGEKLNDKRIIWKLFSVREKGNYNTIQKKHIPSRREIKNALDKIIKSKYHCRILFLDNIENDIEVKSVDPNYIIINSDCNAYLATGDNDIFLGDFLELDSKEFDRISEAKLNVQYKELNI